MEFLNQTDQVIFHTYKRIPIEVSAAEGMYLIGAGGERYLDFLAGIGVNVLGYRHPRLESGFVGQIQRYTHVSNYYAQHPQVELAKRLCGLTGFEKVFFTNSGTEAVEGAIKLARLYGVRQGKTDVWGCSNAFHGRTLGALSLMDRPRYRDGFGPFLPHCGELQFNNRNDLAEKLSEKTAAVFLECVQGEGGIVPATQEFVDTLKELRNKFSFLIVADEIQSGVGRTGKFCAYEHYGFTPDIVTLAKPLGGGLPLGAILTKDNLAGLLQAGMHGTTFGGNPVACTGGCVVLDELTESKLLERVRERGKYFFEGLIQLQKRFPQKIREVRGKGLMLACELAFDGQALVSEMLRRNIIVNLMHGKILRFLPPYIVETAHIDECLANLGEILSAHRDKA